MPRKLSFGFVLIASLALGVAKSALVEGPGDQNHDQNTMAVIKARGFIGEMYTINSNGYPLTLYRVINPLANPRTLNKYPVLYGHGVLYDSLSMISRSENSRPRKPVLGKPTINYGSVDGSDDMSFPFMLSNNNFDVWLYDARGTTFIRPDNLTRVNTAYHPEQWNFSLDDEALVDLPKMIDFVLAKTASIKIVYVGFSESTLFMFALLSTAPDYADKVAAFIAMAPVCYVTHIKGLTFPILAPISALIPDFVHVSIFPEPVFDAVDTLLKELCKSQDMSKLICGSLINGIGGRGSGQQSPEFYRNFFKVTSLRAIKQFIQLCLTDRFGMYDFGELANLQKYGQPNPPAYDLGRIRSDRIILFRGLSDFLSTPEDQTRLVAELGVKPYLDFMLPGYNHFDFVDGKDLIKLVNGPALTAIFQLMYKDGPSIIKDPSSTGRVSSALVLIQPVKTTLTMKTAESAATRALATVSATSSQPAAHTLTTTPSLETKGPMGAAAQASRGFQKMGMLGGSPLSSASMQLPTSYGTLTSLRSPTFMQSRNLLEGTNISEDPVKFISKLVQGNPDPLGIHRTLFSPLN